MESLWMIAQAGGQEVPTSIRSTQPQEKTVVGSQMKKDGSVQDANKTADKPGSSNPFGSPIVLIVLMMVVFYFMLFRSPRKRDQQHRRMVDALEKNDKVRTIGGIIGTVVEVRGNEVLLKVDESNNTKIRVDASAIGKNLSKDNK
jgi:preprotein translocase subunit YajC